MEKVWHIKVSNNNPEHSLDLEQEAQLHDADVAAEAYLTEDLQARIEAAGAHASVSRSFNVGSTPTIIVFVAPVPTKKTDQQVTPQQFFSDTATTHFEITDVTPPAPAAPAQDPGEVKFNVAG